jgi:hypothetical protein
MSLGGLLLGLINIAIYVAVLILIGYIILWIAGIIGFPIPALVQKMYMVIVALIALYLIVSLVLGTRLPFRLVGESGGPPAAITWAYA